MYSSHRHERNANQSYVKSLCHNSQNGYYKTNKNAGKNVEKKKPSTLLAWIQSTPTTFRTSMEISQKTKIELLYNLAISCVNIQPKEK